MTTRSQKRKAAEELISTEMETPLPENTTGENPIVGTSKSPKVTTDSLENIKSVLRKEIMSDLTKILAENQKETLKLIAPTVRKQTVLRSTEDSDSDSENIPENATSTPIKCKTNATSSKITPNNSRNMVTGVLNDTTNQPTKRPKHRVPYVQSKERPTTSKILFAPQPQTFPSANLLPMPKALTASLPVFDGKSEKFELFEDLFRNNIKMYPHLTELQKKIISTHS